MIVYLLHQTETNKLKRTVMKTQITISQKRTGSLFFGKTSTHEVVAVIKSKKQLFDYMEKHFSGYHPANVIKATYRKSQVYYTSFDFNTIEKCEKMFAKLAI